MRGSEVVRCVYMLSSLNSIETTRFSLYAFFRRCIYVTTRQGNFDQIRELC